MIEIAGDPNAACIGIVRQQHPRAFVRYDLRNGFKIVLRPACMPCLHFLFVNPITGFAQQRRRNRLFFRFQANNNFAGGLDAANLAYRSFAPVWIRAAVTGEAGQPLAVEAVQVALQMTDAPLTAITHQEGHGQSPGPDRDAEALRAPGPERPGQKSSQSPEKLAVLAAATAGGKKAEREIGK